MAPSHREAPAPPARTLSSQAGRAPASVRTLSTDCTPGESRSRTPRSQEDVEGEGLGLPEVTSRGEWLRAPRSGGGRPRSQGELSNLLSGLRPSGGPGGSTDPPRKCGRPHVHPFLTSPAAPNGPEASGFPIRRGGGSRRQRAERGRHRAPRHVCCHRPRPLSPPGPGGRPHTLVLLFLRTWSWP